jgi:hypothetical protein
MEMNKNTIAATEKYPVFSIISAWFFVMTVSCKSPDNPSADKHGVGTKVR